MVSGLSETCLGEDDLFREIISLPPQVLLPEGSVSEDEMYVMLARAVRETSALPPLSPSATNIDDLPRDGTASQLPTALRDLGRRIFLRWSRALHDFLCSEGGENSTLRGKLFEALLGKGGGAAAISAIMMSTFGVSPAIAVLVATLLTKIIIAPAQEEICAVWLISLKQ
jgi:hypothetical protein